MIFVIAALGMLMGSIDTTIVAVAIPTLTRSLDTSLDWVGWTLTGYQLAQLVVMPVAGRLSDDLGRKRVFMFCICAFTLGSLLCGLAPNIGFLILFRVLQALGGGGLMPSAVGIIVDHFKDRRSQALGFLTTFMPIGAILGPNVGAWILEHWTWRELFFVNLPIGLLLLLAAHVLLHEQPSVSRPRHIDSRGLALFAAGMIALMYAMSAAGDNPNAWRSPLFWALVPGAIFLFALFVRHEHRTAEPAFEMDLILRQPFLPINIYNLLFGATVFGAISFIPYFAVVQYHMTTAQSGAVMTPRALSLMAMSAVTSLLLPRIGYRLPMIAGNAVVTVALLLLSFGFEQVNVGPFALSSFWLVAAEVSLSGIGMAIAAPASNNAIIDLLPERAASIAAMRGMFRLIGGIFGVSSIALALSFFEDKAVGIRTVYFAFFLVLQLMTPLAMMVPDSARERRKGRRAPRLIEEIVSEQVPAEQPPAPS